MADESYERKKKRSFKPKNIISKSRKLSRSNTSKDDEDRSSSFEDNSRLNDTREENMSRDARNNKSSRDKRNYNQVDEKQFQKPSQSPYRSPLNQQEYSGRNYEPYNTPNKKNNSDRLSPSGSSKYSVPDHRKLAIPDPNSSKTRERPETKPGSSSDIYNVDKDNEDKKNDPKIRTDNFSNSPDYIDPANLSGKYPESPDISNKKHRSHYGDDENTSTSQSKPIDDSRQQARLVSVRKLEDSNIDETGEKARLIGVRRLDTPEPRRKHELSGESDDSSNLSDHGGPRDVFLPKRYILAIMMFMGFVNMYAIRVNLNVAIGAMVNNHTVIRNGVAVIVEPEFNWSSRLQGVVLGAFYYGYMVLQIPGGYFAMRFGGTKIFGGAILAASAFSLLTPVATRYSVWALVLLRVLEGLALGVMLPCNHQIWSLWSPLQERTTLVTIALAGMNVGTVVTMPLTGLLTKYGFDGGWASVFYCFGLFGIMWYILWLFVVHVSPNTHPTISKRERSYINRNIITRKSISVPWKAIFTSRPVWAVIVGNVASDWGLYTILICLPLFLMDIMKFNVQTMGFVASLPFLLRGIMGPIGGVIADILRYKYMSTLNVRRMFYILGAMTAATLIVIAAYSTTPTVVVLSMCIGVAFSGLLHSGYEVNILDIAPSLSGVVMGISNTFGTTTGFLSPLLVGYMTENKLRSEWMTVFWITFFVYAIGTALFCFMCSGEAEHWAIDTDENEEQEYTRNRGP